MTNEAELMAYCRAIVEIHWIERWHTLLSVARHRTLVVCTAHNVIVVNVIES